ncbi:MFS transporter [Candidatus Saganbacteria bacterium]|nr:MFS transporter [Candidatus Saganbacteria bacterium]
MKKVRNSIIYSFWDGCFASVQFGIVEQFATPFALFLGAGDVAIGVLIFIRNTFVAIIQVYSADVTVRLGSRKKLITTAVFIGALLWLPTFFFPLLFARWQVVIFIVFFGLASAFNLFPSPAWASLMSEYIPANKRGRYFGWRGMTLGLIYLGSVMIAGIFLHFFQKISLLWSFGLLFMAAAISRFISWRFLTLMYEPKWRVTQADYFSLWQFISRARYSNFARFAILAALLNFAAALVAPFFAVYILKELKFDYFSFTILISAAVFTTFVTQRYWGEQGDRYGNMKIIRISSFLLAFLPLCWLFSRDFMYLFIIQLLGGFFWAGFNLTSSNFIYDVAIDTKRERCLAYYNFLCGLGLGGGALLGGFLYRYAPVFLGSRFFPVLILSGLLRLLVAGSFCLFTKEVRKIRSSL